jgi:nucleotide-binding universal stress UspA family protein
MYNRILVALDGSQLSESVLPYARSIAKALNIPVELLHVIDPDALKPQETAPRGGPPDLMTAEREHAAAYLRNVAASVSGSAAVRSVVRIGKPADVILEVAEAVPGALIAMSTHGRSGIQRWLLGSIAEKVLYTATSHLLLVRATEGIQQARAAPLKRVLVPLDGSELAEMVIPHAVELARAMDLEVALVRVFGFQTPAFAEGYGPYMEKVWEQAQKDAEDYLEERSRELRAQGLTRISMVSAGGFAAEKIIDLAREKTETMVAMCTHGRTGAGRWVLGSVTERVVRHSGDPVLIIRAPGRRSAS